MGADSKHLLENVRLDLTEARSLLFGAGVSAKQAGDKELSARITKVYEEVKAIHSEVGDKLYSHTG